jgi:hypothetical protein
MPLGEQPSQSLFLHNILISLIAYNIEGSSERIEWNGIFCVQNTVTVYVLKILPDLQEQHRVHRG